MHENLTAGIAATMFKRQPHGVAVDPPPAGALQVAEHLLDLPAARFKHEVLVVGSVASGAMAPHALAVRADQAGSGGLDQSGGQRERRRSSSPALPAEPDGGTTRHRRPGKGPSVSAAVLSVLLAFFSCSYESDENDEDRKHKSKIRVEAVLPQRSAAWPSDVLAGAMVGRRGPLVCHPVVA